MDRQVSNSTGEIDLEKVRPILEGKLDDLPPISSRIVRIFISSTFSDMVEERNAIMEHIYPKLKEFCRHNYGLEFQIMDLRWGIREESQDDHTTIDFCIREIENCKKSSIGPSFVAFLGQKYGYRPFPPNIPADEFHKMKCALEESGNDVAVLEAWFKEDANVFPSIFSLQPISSILKHYNDKDNPDLCAADHQEWVITFENIKNLLRQAVTLCVEKQFLPEETQEKYFNSVTEFEIKKGIPSSMKERKHCTCLVRIIDNLQEFVSHASACKFIDLMPGTSDIDDDAQELLGHLRDQKLPQLLKIPDNMDTLIVTWEDPDTCDPNAQQDYLDEFCDMFFEKMTNLITNAMFEIENLVSDTYVVETLQHLFMCKQRCEIFRGREETLGRVHDYVIGDSNQALVVYGESGCGKTSILAKSASLMSQWVGNRKAVMVLRFLGTSARSSSIRQVLGSICWQIALMYGLDITDIPSDYPELISHFHECLKVASRERPLIIFCDSLDQLSTSHYAHQLTWLPQRLPPNVRMIVSTLPHEYNLLATLNGIITQRENYVQVLPLGQRLSVDIIRQWLAGANRTLQDDQFAIVENALSKCSLPLYTKLVFEEICRWKSYASPDQTTLEFTVKGVINTLFDRVEHRHGVTFVSHALSYLTASRNGLSDAELEDLLSLDDVVLNDVYIHWIPPIRRIPPLLWPRLHDDLSSYIVQREANGIIVFYWYHRQFSAVAKQRYLGDPVHKMEIHSTISDYFLGRWGGGRKKPFTYTGTNVQQLELDSPASEADRKVPQQPLHFGRERMPPFRVRFNLRKLSELPYHLIMSNRVTDLKHEILFNYTWLHTKLSATSLQDVMADFRLSLEIGINDPEIQLLLNTLRVGGSYVNQNPDTLAFDLMGRLLPFYGQNDNIRMLLKQCDHESLPHSALLPVFQCFESPRGVLLYILEEHTQVVLDMEFSQSTNELISVSKDGTIAFWDIGTGERTRTLDVSEIKPGMRTRLHQSSNGKYLVCDSDCVNSPAYIFDLKTGQLVHKCGQRNATQRRGFVERDFLIRQKDIIDMRIGQVVKTLDEFQRTKQYATVAFTHDERFILIGEEKATILYELETQVPVALFPGDNVPSKYAITSDNTRAYVGYAVDCIFKVFDINPESDTFGKVIFTFNYKKAFPEVRFSKGPHYGRELAEITICRRDENVVLLNLKRVNLIVLNIVTQEARLMNTRPIGIQENSFLYGTSFSPDGQFVIAGENHWLHVWRAGSGEHLSTITVHSVFKFPFAISPNRNLVATGSNIHTAIKIWDMDRIQGWEDSQLRIYENPVDMVAVATKCRLLFVKQYYSLSSGRGYKYVDNFGIDVWNMNTGRCMNFLPFAQYGKLLQMEVSPDAQQMVMLLNNRDETYICAIDMHTNQITALFSHVRCHSFVVSNDKEFVATISEFGDSREVRVWAMPFGEEVMCVNDAYSPVFTYDSKNMLCVSGERTIVVCSLLDFSKNYNVLWRVDMLQVVPCRPSFVLATTNQQCGIEHSAKAVLWNFHDGNVEVEFQGIAPSGILDISKDGRLAIDGYLQVFNMRTGAVVLELLGEKENDDSEKKEFTFVQITYDGRYAIWVDDLSIKVCRLSDCKIIANTSTHEKSMCLNSLDYGYFLVIGREDGHVITMKLVDEETTFKHRSVAVTAEERIKEVMSKSSVTDRSIVRMDPYYREKPSSIEDSELPKASHQIQNKLKQKAKVPHAVIQTNRYSISSMSSMDDGEVSDTASISSSVPGSPTRRLSMESTTSSSISGRQRSRSSIQELFSPTKMIRSTSGLFMALAAEWTGSTESVNSPKD